MATVNLRPDAEGTVQQWNSTSAFAHYTEVDDPVGFPDEDGTYVYTDRVNNIEDFNHETSILLVGATITNVRLLVRVRATQPPATPGDDHAIELGLRIGITRYPAPAWHIVNTRYNDITWDWVNNPAPPGNPWTKADIDNLQSSIMAAYFGATMLPAEMRVTQVYFIVTYTPGVFPVAGKGLVSWTP